MSKAPAGPAPAALPGPGEHEVCPFCGSQALVVPSRRLRFVCAVCGRARVPIDDPSLKRSGREAEALDEATRAERASQLWRGFGILVAFLGAATALVFLSFLMLVHPPLGTAVLSGVFALAPSALAAWAMHRARANAERVNPALERGWDAAAADLVAQRPSLTEAELASTLRLSPAQAEAMLVRLSAAGLVGSRLTEAGELTFHPTGRARVAALDAPAPGPAAAAAEARERAELEAALDEAALDEATRAERGAGRGGERRGP
ncbi:MAG TPA: TFIIB-type zinc ribbon-containing protein [Polyangiaceae bacterium]|nr:TFIIB-type zinc ribbon-containing protein [Polyangiaceae bacterium]